MATIYTHAVVGLGLAAVLAPPRRRAPLYWGLAALLAIVPDFDSFTTAAYGTMAGHRGFTHSLIFALWLGFLAASLTFRYLQANLWTLTAIFFAVTASHGLLDACTRGGFGVPFFWPIAEQRFGNWGPIPVADIGFELPDPTTSRAVRSELLWAWLPTIVIVASVTVWRHFRSAGNTSETSSNNVGH